MSTGEFQESLWYSVSLTGSDNIVVGVVYRSPGSTHENDNKLLELKMLQDCTPRTYLLLETLICQRWIGALGLHLLLTWSVAYS